MWCVCTTSTSWLNPRPASPSNTQRQVGETPGPNFYVSFWQFQQPFLPGFRHEQQPVSEPPFLHELQLGAPWLCRLLWDHAVQRCHTQYVTFLIRQCSSCAVLWALDSCSVLCVAGIKPDTHSPGMFSWFPILFPLKVSHTHILHKQRSAPGLFLGLSPSNKTSSETEQIISRVKINFIFYVYCYWPRVLLRPTLTLLIYFKSHNFAHRPAWQKLLLNLLDNCTSLLNSALYILFLISSQKFPHS